MRKIQQSISIVIALLCQIVLAEENIVRIENPAPKGVIYPTTIVESHQDTPKNKGYHGLVAYCYEASNFVIYEENPLGHGYQLSQSQPTGFECAPPSGRISSTNGLGMYIGMAKTAVEALFDVGKLNDKQSLVWKSHTTIKGKVFDVQTYARMAFKDYKLTWLAVFTTTTR